ncbi:MAG: hypothetical protein IANPNBLG_04182 [Bryobacteraceae bacterium]|nr:hypothetical protein [Bryobacteraceae bacterium]MCC6343046.1 hypothetical protein [Bryobacterales bacterium]
MRLNSTRVGLYLLLVFLSGALVGAFGYRLYSANSVSAKANHESYRKIYLNEMQTRLKLTPAQLSNLVFILDETKARFKAARDRMDPEMKQIQHEQRNKIRDMLQPAQKAEYEKMLEERAKKQKATSGGGC